MGRLPAFHPALAISTEEASDSAPSQVVVPASLTCLEEGNGVVSRNVLRLLLVEDNRADSHILIALLRETGIAVEISLVEDGGEAVEYLLNTGKHGSAPRPDVVLLDINLPKKNGFEVLAEVRLHSQLSKLPVFLISTTNGDADISRGYALGISGFLHKPTSLDEFEALVSKFVKVDLPKVWNRSAVCRACFCDVSAVARRSGKISRYWNRLGGREENCGISSRSHLGGTDCRRGRHF